MIFTTKFRNNLILNAYKDHIKEGCKVLSVGCGNCVTDKLLQDRLGCTVFGTDLFDYRYVNIPFKKMVSEDKIPFSDGEFDVVMFNDTLHHAPLRFQEALLLEAFRVGRKVLIFEVAPSLVARLGEFINLLHCRSMLLECVYRHCDDWSYLFWKLGFDYKFSFVKNPWFYLYDNYVFVLIK